MNQTILNKAIGTPIVVTTKPMFIAKLYAKIPAGEIQTQMGRLLRELADELQKQKIAPAGPWFTHHWRGPAEYFDFEVCFPVATPIKTSGRVEAGEWPEMKMVRTVYHGPYEGLAAGWNEFMAAVDAMGLHVSPEIWEVYLIGPETEANPQKWQTELSRAIV